MKIHIFSLGRSIPKEWKIGDKGDVILLQGFAETWYFLGKIGNELNAMGYRIHTIKQFTYNTLPIEVCVEILNKYIEQKELKKVILLSHSKGGIIAKLYMDTNSNSTKVIRSFSIATPYQGTFWGYLYFFSLAECMPGSKLIQRVIGNTNNIDKIVNIYAQFDNHILPNRNAILPKAMNKMIEITGHTRVIEAKQTFQIIQSYL